MSVTFRHNGNPDPINPRPGMAHCMCAQRAPGWLDDATDPSVLREHADPSCALCKGSGVEARPYVEQRGEMNLANENAAVLLAVLCLPAESSGRVGLATLEGAIALARMTPKRTAANARPEESGIGAGGCRWVSAGLPAEKIASYLDRLETLVGYARAANANAITWG